MVCCRQALLEAMANIGYFQLPQEVVFDHLTQE